MTLFCVKMKYTQIVQIITLNLFLQEEDSFLIQIDGINLEGVDLTVSVLFQ